jgi:hypothetical protein
MNRALMWTAIVLLFAVVDLPASSRTTTQLWPDNSTYIELNPNMRFYFLVAATRESGKSTDADFDSYLKVETHHGIPARRVQVRAIGNRQVNALGLSLSLYF